MKKKFQVLATILWGASLAIVSAAELKQEFNSPPDSARPGVYWTIQDGNQDRDEMVVDMNSLNDVGFGSILFMEVDLGYAKGPVPFMSTQWVDNIANAFVHAGTLGMEVIIMTGPGWTGSGGPWTPIEDSMKHLVGSSVQVSGPGTLNQVLPVPTPHPANPHAGMNGTIAAQRNAWFEDVAVIAFPTPSAGTATIGTANSQEVNAKILKGLLPYSSSGAARNLPFVMPQASYTEPGADKVLDDSQVVDLTSLLQPDGSINWTIPAGNWTVMRFVARSTGQTSRPAPAAGYGFDNDKFDGSTFRAHWNNFQKPLLDKIVAQGGPLQPGRGLTTIHLDSWEMSSQNWTGTFRTEFQIRRGYDPQPFYPTWMGQVVGSREETERFLWDMRKTSQELVLEEYAGEIKAVAHENGLLYSNQPYDMNPAGDMDLVSVADIPSCEFWNDTFNTQYGVIEAVSTARTMGPQLVRAEAYTSGINSFAKNPANMKNQTDWAFAIGINGFVFHGSAHQPLGDAAKPGMTFGGHGINLSRHNTLWDYLPDYNRYLARCSHILRQGEAVGDILYLAPEAAPHVFEAPADATEGVSSMRDKRGYSFDAVTPRILGMRATVDGDRIAFPDGSKYRVLVLPDVPTMTPETLAKIDQLVQAGATIIGKPPVKSPSLVNYPACDTSVSTLATAMWGGATAPGSVTPVSRGSGTIYWGGNLDPGAALYPSYAATASVLAGLGLAEDFTSPSGKLRYQHRVTAERDIYFVSNRTGETLDTDAVFRIDGLAPKLWDPVSGETRALEEYSSSGGVTTVALTFKPAQSYFIVFPHSSSGSTPPTSPEDNFPAFSLASKLGGSWDVAFDPALGGPASVTFASLVDWTQRPEPGIRYYSGTATYTKNFDLPGYDPADGYDFFLDVGAFNGICEVRLNGQDLGSAWTAPWRVDITAALQASGNQLEIEVVNNWVNRLIGDQQPADKNVRSLSWPSGLLGGGSYGAGRYTFATTSPWAASSPLQSAGLLGPVSLLTSGPDGFPPASTNLLPADDTTTLFVPSSLLMTFSEPVTVGTGTITIKNLSDSSQTTFDITDGTQVSVTASVLTITPAGGFLADKNYAVRIDSGAITDAAGNPFAGIGDDTTWNFTTSATTAQVIVQDGFSGSFVGGNGAMAGRTPDTVNLPGNTYTEQQNANVGAKMELDTTNGNPGNSLKTGFNNSAHLQYSNSGTPTVPITLSMDVQINTIADDTAARGIGLGFWSPLPTLYPGTEPFATTHFTGILVNPSGTLEYVRGGVSQGIFTTAPAGFSTGSFLNITYTVDPVSGRILNLEFNGTDYTADFLASFPANFTLSDTAGFLGSTAANAGYFGRVDNFIIATTKLSSGQIYSEDFEEIYSGNADVVDGGVAGIYTASTWPTAPEFVLSGALVNLLKPAVGSAWLDPVPGVLGTTFATLHSGVTATADLSDTFADHTTYTLTFTHFRRDDLDGDEITAKILTVDGTELVSQTFPAVTASGTYLTRTLFWNTSGGPELGQAIRLQFLDPNGGDVYQQAAIDNISLDAADVATPGRTRVFLLAGQSNMSGQGTHSELIPPYDTAQTNVAFWNNGDWVDLAPGFGNTSAEFGPEVSFGYTVKQSLLPDRILLVKYATNGTALYNDWAPPAGPEYSTFTNTAHAALANLDANGVDYEISAMLWLQGESDALEGQGAAYETNLRNFIADMRTQFNAPDLPFCIARVTTAFGTAEQSAMVRTAQVDVAESTANVEWFDTDSHTLIGGHYNTAGQISIGVDFANTYLASGPSGTFSGWAKVQGLDGTAGKESGFFDDPDGDGVINGFEWISGGNPLIVDNSSQALVPMRGSNSTFCIDFAREEDAIGRIDLDVEWSTNLVSGWINSFPIYEFISGSYSKTNGVVVTIDDTPDPDRVSVRVPDSFENGRSVFFRLKASQP